MAAPLPHRFHLRPLFGPPELFAILREVAESPRHQEHAPEFEFEWLRRRVALCASDRAVLGDMLEEFLTAVNRAAGPGLMLPGDVQTPAPGRFVQPIGVLVQTPDIYLQIMLRTLEELGIRGAEMDADGESFQVPVTTRNMALGYTQMIASFPLPDYLRLEDLGTGSP